MSDARDAAEKRAREFFRREFGTILDQGEPPRRPQLERALTALLLSWGEEQRKEVTDWPTQLIRAHRENAALTAEVAELRGKK